MNSRKKLFFITALLSIISGAQSWAQIDHPFGPVSTYFNNLGQLTAESACPGLGTHGGQSIEAGSAVTLDADENGVDLHFVGENATPTDPESAVGPLIFEYSAKQGKYTDGGQFKAFDEFDAHDGLKIKKTRDESGSDILIISKAGKFACTFKNNAGSQAVR